MTHKFVYKSVLAPYITRFVEMQQAQGYVYHAAQFMLKEIDDFYIQNNITEPVITKSIYQRWLASRIYDSSIRIYNKAVKWRQFAEYLVLCGVPCEVPRPPRPAKPEHMPYVLTHGQIEALFTAVDKMEQCYRNYNNALFSMPAIFRFIYATGARETEVTSLINSDVDLTNSVALIRNPKNNLNRYVPLSESLKIVLEQYLSARKKLPISGAGMPNAPFFVKANGSHVSPESVYDRFRKAIEACGIPYYGNRVGPVVHSLRHTYAVHAFMKAKESDMPLDTSLPIIQTCLGHRSTEATERYVRLTHEMYPELISKEEMLSVNIFPTIEYEEQETN